MPRALMAVAPRTTELVEYEKPPLGDRDVRIRSEFAAPKHGTESHAYLDDQRRLARRFHPEYRIFVPAEDAAVTPFPRRLGNMTVGTVTEVGGAVTRFKVGDRVYGHLPIRETHTVPEDGPRKSMAAGAREQELHLMPPELSPEQVVLLDPAHNVAAAAALGDYVSAVFPTGLPFVFGALEDKDVAGMLEAVGRAATRIVCAPIRSRRACPPKDLVAIARAARPDLPVTAAESPQAALAAAWNAHPLAVVSGSAYLVGEVLHEIGNGRRGPEPTAASG